MRLQGHKPAGELFSIFGKKFFWCRTVFGSHKRGNELIEPPTRQKIFERSALEFGKAYKFEHRAVVGGKVERRRFAVHSPVPCPWLILEDRFSPFFHYKAERFRFDDYGGTSEVSQERHFVFEGLRWRVVAAGHFDCQRKLYCRIVCALPCRFTEAAKRNNAPLK